jgi:GNAT superfamily N-acetyltransferase
MAACESSPAHRDRQEGKALIRRLGDADQPAILEIINDGATAYRGVIPADCWHEPYMSAAQLRDEIAAGVEFHGWEEGGRLLGVMGIQQVRDATLIRHAYTRTAEQGRGIGGRLLLELSGRASGRLLVGTWAAATWAICFYERRGFSLVGSDEKDRLLRTYWTVPARQRDVSVVLTGATQGATERPALGSTVADVIDAR